MDYGARKKDDERGGRKGKRAQKKKVLLSCMSNVCAVEVLQYNQSPTVAGRSSAAALPGKAGQAHRAGQCFGSQNNKVSSYSSAKWIVN